ncbi:MAG TPA: hypothetical protein VEK07_09170 [Polyangiaceae bacterium]|nr:hypothetical protein [Polyangiaceae bacterium]
MRPSARTSLVLDALRQALTAIASLPCSDEVAVLRARCTEFEQRAREWSQVRPTPEERETVMKAVLTLHASIAKVRRSSRPPPGAGEGGSL